MADSNWVQVRGIAVEISVVARCVALCRCQVQRFPRVCVVIGCKAPTPVIYGREGADERAGGGAGWFKCLPGFSMLVVWSVTKSELSARE